VSIYPQESQWAKESQWNRQLAAIPRLPA
jgi:hypothetical protein